MKTVAAVILGYPNGDTVRVHNGFDIGGMCNEEGDKPTRLLQVEYVFGKPSTADEAWLQGVHDTMFGQTDSEGNVVEILDG